MLQAKKKKIFKTERQYFGRIAGEAENQTKNRETKEKGATAFSGSFPGLIAPKLYLL